MQSTGARIGVLALLAAAAVVLFFVLSAGDGDDADRADSASMIAAGRGEGTGVSGGLVEMIRIRDGAPVGGVQRLAYERGDTIQLEVVPDPGVEEIHVHGYEITEEVVGTKPVMISFPAEIAGGFEVEAHGDEGEFPIAELRVNP